MNNFTFSDILNEKDDDLKSQIRDPKNPVYKLLTRMDVNMINLNNMINNLKKAQNKLRGEAQKRIISLEDKKKYMMYLNDVEREFGSSTKIKPIK